MLSNICFVSYQHALSIWRHHVCIRNTRCLKPSASRQGLSSLPLHASAGASSRYPVASRAISQPALDGGSLSQHFLRRASPFASLLDRHLYRVKYEECVKQ